METKKLKVRLVKISYADGFERLKLEEWIPQRNVWQSIYERSSSETYEISSETIIGDPTIHKALSKKGE